MQEHAQLWQALASQYRVERKLGRGGFATVFLAHDIRHERPVALKVLHPEIASTLGPERFRKEIRVSAKLQHPHILSVFDSGEANGQLWFSMPYVEGETLRDRLNRERQLPLDTAVSVVREVADALDYAHRHGVIHRDIKPENLLMQEGHVLVGDFGIARAVTQASDETQTGMAIGTPGYMSPEQASGAGSVDARSDIYSLGCVFYEMLTGEAPFTGPTPQAILTRALTETPRPVRQTRPGVSVGVEAATERCLARVPADRFQTPGEFANALIHAAAERSPSQAVPAPAVATVATPAPSRRIAPGWAMVAAGIGLLAIIAGGIWMVSRRHNPTSSVKRLAVLPFENLGSPDDEYFADGMTDEVRGKLAAVAGLQVTARSSSNQYRKANSKTPVQIGQELGVDYILTGTVRWEKTATGSRRVRVSPELIRADDGIAQWQQGFDTELNDVFQVQADIASRVAGALDVALGGAAKQQLEERPTGNVEAYDAFLRGEKISQSATLSDAVPLRKAIGFYRQAVDLDPKFVLAWAQMSRCACSNASASPTPEDIATCKDGAERALALAPQSADAHMAMGVYYRLVARDFDKALEEFTIGLQQHPNHPGLLTQSATVERALGRFESALTHLQQSSRLDPRAVLAASSLARTYHDLHRFDDARVEYDRALSLAPSNLAVVQSKATNYLSQGDLEGARNVIRDALQHVDAKAIIVRFATFQEMMWALPDDMRARVVELQPEDFDNDRGMWALKVGATYWLKGDVEKARSYGKISADVYQKKADAYPDDPQQQELYGRALALAGRGPEAGKAGERSLALRGATLDAVSGPYYRYQVARVYIQSGQLDKALDLIEPLLGKPGDITPGWLRIDPIFKPLYGNPRFDRLAERTH